MSSRPSRAGPSATARGRRSPPPGGLKGHDGKPVTSDDVIPSIERWAKRDSMGQALAATTKEWKKVDDKTFQLVLKEPFGLVLDAIGKPSSNVPFIMPKDVASAPAEKLIADH